MYERCVSVRTGGQHLYMPVQKVTRKWLKYLLKLRPMWTYKTRLESVVECDHWYTLVE